MTAQNSINGEKKPTKAAASTNENVGFIRGLRSEFKRITWASKENVKKATATVLTFCVVYIAIVGLLDSGFQSLFRLIFK